MSRACGDKLTSKMSFVMELVPCKFQFESCPCLTMRLAAHVAAVSEIHLGLIRPYSVIRMGQY